MVTLPEKVINSQYADRYPYKRTVPYDFSQTYEEKPKEAQLRAKAQAYMNASGVGVPKVSIKLSFISLADTEEFKEVAALQNVNLCDNINVYFEKLGINTTAEIVGISYDVLREKYNSIEIGTLRSNLAGAINANSQGITNLANNTQRMFREYSGTVTELVDEATAWLTSGDGFVVATKDDDGNWKEILFMDTNDIETATNVLRINQNGIGFSSTGVDGPYTQAWTLDGRMVIGGTNAPSLTVYDNSQNILFQINHEGMVWNAENSSLSQDGTFSTSYNTGSGIRKTFIKQGHIIFDFENSGGQLLTYPPTISADQNGMGPVGDRDNLEIKSRNVTIASNYISLMPRSGRDSGDDLILRISAGSAKVIKRFNEKTYCSGWGRLKVPNLFGDYKTINERVTLGNGKSYSIINGIWSE